MARRSGATTIEFNDGDENATITTSNRKWINRLEALAEAGHATEYESEVAGARVFEVGKGMLRMPVHRTPRSWTDEQREESRARLAGVRDRVKAQREAEASKTAKASKNGKTAETPAATTKAGKVAKPAPMPGVPDKKAVKATQEVAAKTAAGKATAKPVAKPGKPATGAKAKRQVAEVELDDEEDEDVEVEEDEDEDEAEEIVVKKPAARKPVKA